MSSSGKCPGLAGPGERGEVGSEELYCRWEAKEGRWVFLPGFSPGVGREEREKHCELVNCFSGKHDLFLKHESLQNVAF